MNEDMKRQRLDLLLFLQHRYIHYNKGCVIIFNINNLLNSISSSSSSVSSERDLISSLPILLDTGSLLVVVMSLDSESSVLLASVGESSVFSVFVFITTDPVHSWVSSNGLVEGVQ